ncbi:MAG: MoxR family ATPase [Deltaproteobacteria bacterium]
MSGSIEAVRAALARVIRGKPEAIELVLVGILSEGHVLIEDVPGVGKTTLAKALAKALALEFTRVQFTPDLLPTDILGTSILEPSQGTFRFEPGPIFTQVMLADEINRASPRTQSALLEAMSERQVTLDGKTRTLPAPFFVLATQNPADSQGTYPLPEAQLDRFRVRVTMGYPTEAEELEVLFDRKTDDPLDAVQPVLDGARVTELITAARRIEVQRDVALYALRLVRATRDHLDLEQGVSPRGAIALYRAAQARALITGRDYVSPDDVQALAEPVLAHRLRLGQQARYGGKHAAQIVREIVAGVAVPT